VTTGPPRVAVIVDDDPVVRSLLAELLREEFGLTVVTAADGVEGIASVREHRPELVIFDVRMPGVDGFEFCARVREDPELAGVRLVALSALAPVEEARERALAAGCVDFVAKPFELDDVLGVARRALGMGPAAGGPV
jgi:CheY-like chemotaxis protein